MSISQDKYIEITSGVGGGNNVALPALVARLFSNNPLIERGAPMKFTNAADVLAFFGAGALANRAAAYFSYISPAITSPQELQIAFAAGSGVELPAEVNGAVAGHATLAAFKTVVSGNLSVTISQNQTAVVTALDLSGATSLSGVAALIQAAIRTGGTGFGLATVTYSPVTDQFLFQCAPNLAGGNQPITTVPASMTNDLAPLLGWTLAQGAKWVDGSAGSTLAQQFAASVAIDNNFGSFSFVEEDSLYDGTGLDVQAVAQVNATYNNKYQYYVACNAARAATWAGLVSGIAGVALNLTSLTNSPVAETVGLINMLPHAIMAATDYYTINSTVNYMFKQMAGIPADVKDDATAATYDALAINYYGETQVNGQYLSFYQNGYLQGGATDARDMGVYANESWFKGYLASQFMTLFLSLNKVGANKIGRGQLSIVLQEGIDVALNNGTISVGKTLTTAQQLFITQQTGDANAWQQVQNVGYWKDLEIVPVVQPNGLTQYNAVYTLIYSKNDVVRKVSGTHELI